MRATITWVIGAVVLTVAGPVMQSKTSGDRPQAGAQQDAAGRIEEIHKKWVFADMHSHPNHFHRDNVAKFDDAELSRYRRGRFDVIASAVTADGFYSGNFTNRDGSYIAARQYHPKPGEVFGYTIDRLLRIDKTVQDGDAALALSPADVLKAKERGQIALLPALEGADGLEGQLENVRVMYGKGVRLIQLVHLRPNELGGIQSYPFGPAGLTPFGKAVVQECNRLGIVIDLAHANTETQMDVLKVSKHPVIFSHTAAKVLHEGDRHLSDAEMKAIAGAGGVIGIWVNKLPFPRLDDMMRDIDHVKSVVGIDHVGIGTDLRGLDRQGYTEGFGEDANFPNLEAALIARGYSDDEVGKILGGNFFRVWSKVTTGASPSRTDARGPVSAQHKQ
jgi:membrane dipeptidase